MKQNKIFQVLVAALIGLLTQSAHAVFIDQGTSVMDTNTNLEWLKLSSTDAMSYNQAGATYAADGWAYATEAQYLSMFDAFFPSFVDSGSGVQSVYDAATMSDAAYVASLFGITASSTLAYYTYGMFMGSDNNIKYGGVQIGTTYANLHRYKTTSFTTDTVHASLGVFMVKYVPPPEEKPAPLTEPASLILFGLGIIGLAVSRRKGA